MTLSQEISVADIVAGKLVFSPAANANGLSYADFDFKVRDDGGTDDGGIDLDPSANTITLDVTSVNDAPSGSDDTITILEDGSHVFVTADFGFSDPNDSPADAFASVKITSLPTAGALELDGVGVTLNQEISVADIVAGKLVFSPAANANGLSYADFDFKVRDDGGTDDGGIDLDPSANTITLDVTEVNDVPNATAGSDQVIDEGGIASVDATFTDVDSGQTHTCSIDWDDGSSSVGLVVEPSGSTPGTCTGSHMYPDDDPTGTSSDEYTVSVTIVDDGTTGGAPDPRQDTASLTVTVSNVAPVITLNGGTAVNEGGSLNYTYTWTDPGTDSWTRSISCGTGGVASANVFDESTKSGSFTCSWADDNPTATPSDSATVSVTVTDDDTGSDTKSKTVTVSNVAPVITLNGGTAVNEGGSLNYTYTWTDPGTDSWTRSISCGTGGVASANVFDESTKSGSFTCSWADDNPTATPSDSATVSVTVTDDDTGSDTKSKTVTVSNVAPVITLNGGTAVNEGGSLNYTYTWTDPGTDSWTRSISCGTGGVASANVFDESTKSGSFTCSWADDNPTATPSDSATVSVTVTDDDTGSDTKSKTVTVSNVAPVITLNGGTAVNEGGSLNYTYTWTDPGTDSWTRSISCGTGGVASANVFDESTKSGSFTFDLGAMTAHPTATPCGFGHRQRKHAKPLAGKRRDHDDNTPTFD